MSASCPTCGPRCTTEAHEDEYIHEVDGTDEDADAMENEMTREWR